MKWPSEKMVAAVLQRLQDVSYKGACFFGPGKFGGIQDLDHAAPFSRVQ